MTKIHSRNQSTKKSDNQKNDLTKLIIFGAIFATIFLANVGIAHAFPWDSVIDTWQGMSKFILSGKFWINALIMFGILVLLYILIFDRGNTGTNHKTILYIALIIFALVIATKFIDSHGDPQYLWDNTQIQQITQFILGKPGTGAQATCSSSASSTSNTCCGAGAYYLPSSGTGANRMCRQGILRINEVGGKGLPTFLIASILFILLFLHSKESLKFNSMGDSAGTWMPVILGAFLGAMIANQGIQKNFVIVVGGWIAMLMIGKALSKSLNDPPVEDKKQASPMSRGFAFGLSYAFVETITNLLGTTLLIRVRDNVDMWSILTNICIGVVIGLAWSIVSGEGIIGEYLRGSRADQRKDIDFFMKNKQPLRALGRAIPLIGELNRFKPTKSNKDDRETIKKITDGLAALNKRKRSLNPGWGRSLSQEDQDELDNINQKISILERALIKEEAYDLDEILERYGGED